MAFRRIAAGTAAVAMLGTVFVAGPAAAKNKGETDLTLSKGLVQSMDAAGVGIKAIRGATLSKSGVVNFRVTSVKGSVITHKGALLFSSSTGSVTLQNIALDYKTGHSTALVEERWEGRPPREEHYDVLTFTGGKKQIKKNGTWKNAKVALTTQNSGAADPVWLFKLPLGVSMPSGMTFGKASITLNR